MRRHFAVLCAVGFLGLVAFSPVLAASASSSTAAAKKPPKSSASSSSTTNTSGKAAPKKSSTTPPTDSQGPSQGSPSQGSPSQSSACGTPETAHEPAPAQGSSQTYPAANAGAVDVQRASQSDLKVANVTANTGWTYKVIQPSGPRISVRFIDQANPSSAVHFAAQMDQAGRDIHVRVTSC
jgi:cytoskeletal protein RodZ